MFETSVVQARPQATRRFGLLSISIFAHSAIIVGAVVVSVASVDFPKTAPDEMANAPSFRTVEPPPLGNPNGGAPQQPKVTPPAPPKEQPAPDQTAPPPEVIPDAVPTLAEPSATSDALAEGPSDGRVPGPIGEFWGKEGAKGPLGGPPATDDLLTPAPEPVFWPGGEVKPPVLISRVDPQYPEFLRKTGMSATVVVRCVIDKNGNVRDAKIEVPAMTPFNDAVMNVIGRWRYKPGTRRGQAVETYMTLTVRFQINR